MTDITLLDTARHSDNLGDQIIMDAVMDALHSALGDARITHSVATHRYAKPRDYLAMRRHRFAVLGGTNALKSHMFVRSNWKVTPMDIALLRDVVLLGIGWQQYQGSPDRLTKWFFGSVLSKNHLHSVRDSHSLAMLGSCVKNVVNTSCPTLWALDQAALERIPVRKARKAVFALTHYRPHANDLAIYEHLLEHYEEVFFWPQQAEDVPYAASLGMDRLTPIAPAVEAYNAVLDREDVDFVGARLHGGIRALQRGRRALVLAVDNRANEIAKDTQLPVLPRDSVADIAAWIAHPVPMRLTLPHDAIAAWKGQFARAA